MKTINTLFIAALVVIVGAIAFAWSGIFNVAASSPHTAAVKWLLTTTMHASVERRAESVTVPEIDDEELIRAGAGDFDAMCAFCHGAPGRERDAVGKGLNPPPPDLSDAGEHMTAAEIFWVTRHGIRMTGMPAWGETHKNDELWPVTAFIARKLPDITPEDYQSLLKAAAGSGHHDGETGHASGGTDQHEDAANGSGEAHDHPHGDKEHVHNEPGH